MDETRLKPFRPYNIIMVAQSGQKVGGNISICENHDLRFSCVFLSKGSFQLLEVAS
jgi:hypothetical protein